MTVHKINSTRRPFQGLDFLLLFLGLVVVTQVFAGGRKNPFSNKTPWQVLSLSENATIDEIRRAYKKLALANHPDRVNQDPEKILLFKEAAWAFEELDDHLKDWVGTNGITENKPKGGSFDSPNFRTDATVQKWLRLLEASYERQMQKKRSGQAISPLSEIISEAFGEIGGSANVHRQYGNLFQTIGMDGPLLDALSIFLMENLPHYLSLRPSAKELIEIGNSAFNYEFGRGSTDDPRWVRFGKRMSWLMKEAQEVANNPQDFADAVRYEFSLEPFPGAPLDSPHRFEIYTRPKRLLWDRAEDYASRFNVAPEELLIHLLATLPSDYQSKNSLIASTIYDMAKGEDLWGFVTPDITDKISADAKFRIAILIRDIAQRQDRLSEPGYRLGSGTGHLGRRASAWLEELKIRHPDLALMYRSHFSLFGRITHAIGKTTQSLCQRVFGRLPAPSIQKTSGAKLSAPNNTKRLPPTR